MKLVRVYGPFDARRPAQDSYNPFKLTQQNHFARSEQLPG